MKNSQTNESNNRLRRVVLAITAALVVACVLAYFADASTTIRNLLGSGNSTHLEVEITETDVPHDNGDKAYNMTSGATADMDPKVTVDTNGDAYVYAIVKDTVNIHGKKLVDYQIADGWVELDKRTLTDKDIQKYNEIFTDKDMDADTVHIDVDDPYTHIYYRIVNGTDNESRFEYPVLKGNSISYPSTLTNEDLALLKSITEAGDRALDFQTYAVQMTPFCPADKVKDADPTSDEQKGYAAEAWNQKAPAPAATDISDITTKAHSLTVYPTVPGDQYIVVPKGTTPITDDMWTSTGQTSNGGEALTFTGLDADTAYNVISRTPATSDQGEPSEPSEPTVATTKPLATGLTVTEKSGKTEVMFGDTLQMKATIEPEFADQDVTWSSSDPGLATVDPLTGEVSIVGNNGTVIISATAMDGSGVKGDYQVTVLSGKLLYQVQLKSVSSGTATFWPAFGVEPENWGKQDSDADGIADHDGDCIVDHTWAEITSQTDSETGESLDFSNCTCTKDVPINPSKNATIFQTYNTDHRESAFTTKDGLVLKSAAGWSHGTLTNAVTNCCEIEGVNVRFFDLSEANANTMSQNARNPILSNGYHQGWWTSNEYVVHHLTIPDHYYGVFVGSDGVINKKGEKSDDHGVVLGLTVTAN